MAENSIRFHCHALARSQAIASRIPRAVMDVEPNIMSQVMGEKNTHCLMRARSVSVASEHRRTYISRYIKPKLF